MSASISFLSPLPRIFFLLFLPAILPNATPALCVYPNGTTGSKKTSDHTQIKSVFGPLSLPHGAHSEAHIDCIAQINILTSQLEVSLAHNL